jgi:hypothetical protein
VAELDLRIDHGMGAVVRVAWAIVVERGRIADEVELAVVLAVHARIVGRIVVHVGNLDVAEAAPELVWHRVLREVLDGL